MNKKFITLLAFWFLALNFFSIKNFSLNAYWNNFFEKKWYIDAEKIFSKSWNIFWVYDEANSLYKQWKFSDAIKKYFSILWDEKNSLNFNLNHNIWNSYYRIWEKSEKIEEKKSYREKSVEYYKNALDVKYDEETKKNLEFVLNKIKKLWEKNKKSEDKKNQNNSKNSDSKNGKKSWEKKDWISKKGKNWEKKDGKSWKKDWEKKWGNKSANSKWKGDKKWEKSWTADKNWEKWKKNSDWKSWENSQQNSWISKQQEQALKQYEKSLQNTQKQAGNYFNKVYQENKSNDPFDSFFQNDPFFNNWDLNWWKEEKKDW